MASFKELQDRMKELEEMEASLAVEKARVASGLQAAKRQRRRELEARDQLLAREIAELQEEQQRNRAEREELASVPHSSQGSFVSHHEPPTPPAEHGRDLCAEGAGELKLEDVLALNAEENTIDPRRLNRATSPSPPAQRRSSPLAGSQRSQSVWPGQPPAYSTPAKRAAPETSERSSAKRRSSMRPNAKTGTKRCPDCPPSLNNDTADYPLLTCAVPGCAATFCLKHVSGPAGSGVRTPPLFPICHRHPRCLPTKGSLTHPDLLPRATYKASARVVEHWPIVERILGFLPRREATGLVLDLVDIARHLVPVDEIAQAERLVRFKILGVDKEELATERYLTAFAPITYGVWARQTVVPRRPWFRCDDCSGNQPILEQLVLRCQAPGCMHTTCALCAKISRNPLSYLCATHRDETAMIGFLATSWKLVDAPGYTVQDISGFLTRADLGRPTMTGQLLKVGDELDQTEQPNELLLYDCTLLGIEGKRDRIDAIVTRNRLLRDCPGRFRRFLRAHNQAEADKLFGPDETPAHLQIRP